MGYNQNYHEGLLRQIFSKLTTSARAVGHEIVTFAAGTVYSLNVPEEARYAICVLEEVGGGGTSKLIRYWTDNSNPTVTDGIVRGDMDAFDIAGYSNLKQFKAIKIAGGAHRLTVQYYS